VAYARLVHDFFVLLSEPCSSSNEVLALRHQLTVLQRSVKRPKLTAADRFLWAWLAEFWRDWRSMLIIVKPETVIGWHRKGF
jgi:putative transposase